MDARELLDPSTYLGESAPIAHDAAKMGHALAAASAGRYRVVENTTR